MSCTPDVRLLEPTMPSQTSPLSLFDVLRRLLSSAAQPAPVTQDEIRRTLDKIDRIARVMDASFFIPGLNRRAGLDSILGLIPGIGDFAAGAVSAYLIMEARRIGAPPVLLARMAGNIAIDTVIGIVPGLGDLFDVAFKANMRNALLLRAHFGQGRPDARSPYDDGRGPVIDVEPVRHR